MFKLMSDGWGVGKAEDGDGKKAVSWALHAEDETPWSKIVLHYNSHNQRALSKQVKEHISKKNI